VEAQNLRSLTTKAKGNVSTLNSSDQPTMCILHLQLHGYTVSQKLPTGTREKKIYLLLLYELFMPSYKLSSTFSASVIAPSVFFFSKRTLTEQTPTIRALQDRRFF